MAIGNIGLCSIFKVRVCTIYYKIFVSIKSRGFIHVSLIFYFISILNHEHTQNSRYHANSSLKLAIFLEMHRLRNGNRHFANIYPAIDVGSKAI